MHGTRHWPITLLWKCPQPWYEGWIEFQEWGNQARDGSRHGRPLDARARPEALHEPVAAARAQVANDPYNAYKRRPARAGGAERALGREPGGAPAVVRSGDGTERVDGVGASAARLLRREHRRRRVRVHQRPRRWRCTRRHPLRPLRSHHDHSATSRRSSPRRRQHGCSRTGCHRTTPSTTPGFSVAEPFTFVSESAIANADSTVGSRAVGVAAASTAAWRSTRTASVGIFGLDPTFAPVTVRGTTIVTEEVTGGGRDGRSLLPALHRLARRPVAGRASPSTRVRSSTSATASTAATRRDPGAGRGAAGARGA